MGTIGGGEKGEGNELTEGEPGEDDRRHVVEKLNVKDEHADDVVTAPIHASKVHEGVDAGGERAVEPSTSLGDELGRPLGHVRLALGCLHVSEMPLGAGFGDELETEDPIFGQEHVLLEDVHAFDPFLPQLFGQAMITVEVLLQRTTHDSAETIGREGSGQDAHVAKGTLERLVEDVADLVLKILYGHQRIEQLLPSDAQHGVNLATGPTEILVIVECLPQRQ